MFIIVHHRWRESWVIFEVSCQPFIISARFTHSIIDGVRSPVAPCIFISLFSFSPTYSIFTSCSIVFVVRAARLIYVSYIYHICIYTYTHAMYHIYHIWQYIWYVIIRFLSDGACPNIVSCRVAVRHNQLHLRHHKWRAIMSDWCPRQHLRL